MTTARRSLRARVALAATVAFAAALAGSPLMAYSPPKEKYSSMPFMSLARATPQVLLVISKDHKMFTQAYNNLTDLNGDGKIDSGFNPSITYYGYFDSGSCYKHQNWRFERAGFTDMNHPEALKPTRPASLKDRMDIAVPRTAHGVCPGSNDNGTGLWHGNWLNWFVTSQMDAIRRVLYGGKRKIDNSGETVLMPSYVPRDCHVWGIEVTPDDLWAARMRNMPYYDLSLYTGFNKPAPGTYTFFARYQPGDGNGGDPLIGAATNVKVDHKVKYFKTEIKIWDYVAGEELQPDFSDLPWGHRRFEFIANVKVCDPRAPGGISPGDGCEEYSNRAWKPVGLLQEYGADNRMYFGLMTGAENVNDRLNGGVIRRHIESMGLSYDYVNGQVKNNGIIDILDKLRITGWSGTWYREVTAWGAPLGEMMYEAVRYFGGAKRAHFTQRTNDTFSQIQLDWEKGRPKGLFSSECARPVVVLISHAYPDHDADGFPPGNSPEVDRLMPLRSLRSPAAALKTPFDLNRYLNAISGHEGISGDVKRRFFYSTHIRDDCSPKRLASLFEVKGLCPSEPTREGSYSTAAVAWFAHTHNLSSSQDSESPMELFTVALSNTFPEISFDLEDGRAVTLIPGSEVEADWLLEFLNYFVVDWQTDSTGLPFYIKMVVNFEDRLQGSDYDRDALGTFELSLLTTRDLGVPDIQLEPQAIRIHAGELKDPFPEASRDPFGRTDPPTRFYRYQNYRTPDGGRDYGLPKITIDRSKVVGFSVSSDAFGSTSAGSHAVGYTISGTTRDGTYMDVTHGKKNFKVDAKLDKDNPWPNLIGIPTNFSRPDTLDKPRSSPWTCLYPGQSGCGKGSAAMMTYYMTRGFRFNRAESKPEYLPDPLWLAAKYGGFKDRNHNGVPDAGEWERDPAEASPEPANYFRVSSAGELREQLNNVFKSISRGLAFGSSTAASMVSDSAGGLSIQTVFYPKYTLPEDPTMSVPFVGSVFALFLDGYGNLREDTDRDGRLTLKSSGGKGDRIVTLATVSREPENPPPCYVQGRYITLCDDPGGNNRPVPASGPNASPENPHKLNAVWDAGRWLMELDDAGGWRLTSGPRDWNVAATQSLGRRRIYFGYRDKNLKVIQTLFDFRKNRAQLSAMVLHDNYKEYFPQGVRGWAVEELANWVTGREYNHLRKRLVTNPWTGKDKRPWRLGDVMNSKPIVVGAPASSYELLFRDRSYRQFKRDRAKRRQMVYFGANDGMLHAVNMGFGGTGRDGTVRYSASDPDNPKALKHDLGAELWAYIPASLMPTLPFLADPNYLHSYYVDLKPLISDAKIDGEWRTLLIGGLRLGGRPIEPGAEDHRKEQPYFGEVFCFDVTDPESEPRLMWTYSSIELGLMVGMPVTVRNRDRFYVLLPSGPVTDSVTQVSKDKIQINYGGRSPYTGVSRQEARVIVLDAATGEPVVSPEDDPDYLRAPTPESFFSNAFLPAGRGDGKGGWSDHAAYFGMTETGLHGEGRDGGAVWRVQMADPFGEPLPPPAWKLRRLADVGRPVTGAVNSTRDSAGNIWVIFGTGRLFGQNDVSPCDAAATAECRENHDQFLMGVKEPLNSRGLMTFGDVTGEMPNLLDVTGAMVLQGGEVVNLKPQAGAPSAAGGIPYMRLETAIRTQGVPGWKRRLDAQQQLTGIEGRLFEMVVTQPKLVSLGNGRSLLSVTSFRPGEDSCTGYGEGFLYAVDSFTGLPRPDTRGMFRSLPVSSTVPEGTVSGVISLGVGNPTEASVLVAGGKTIIRAAASDGGVTDLEYLNTRANTSGFMSWREVMDSGFRLTKDAMVLGIGDE
ncbi:MAG: hypothetical protein LBR80_00650 [Deltaproteobacteria bacterium]|jgi:type IV pilus assembly protein PilY1|nr:hypothetical protein [Deltaproteobacteria bacterium]